MNRIKYLENLLSEDPKDTFVLFALAKEHAQIENYDLSEKYFLRLKEIDPGYVGMYYHLGKLYEAVGRTDTASHTYKLGIEQSKSAKDSHAESELRGALMNLLMDMD